MKRRTWLHTVATAAAMAPWARVGAQSAPQPRRIAVLEPNRAASMQASPAVAAFIAQLDRAGWILGQNLQIEALYAEGYVDRLPALADALVQQAPALIVAVGNDAAAAARRATPSIPIVMAFVAEPVAAGFVHSLARPGGPLTGVAWLSAEVASKSLEWLREAVPGLQRLAGLGNPAMTGHAPYREAYFRAANAWGLQTLSFPVATPDEVGPALQRIAAARVQALYVNPDPATEARIEEIAAFGLQQRLPVLAISPTLLDAGALLCYGPDMQEMIGRIVSFIDRILRGARPADLPVEQPSRYEPMVNLRTARALGLMLPRSVLLRATRVVE